MKLDPNKKYYVELGYALPDYGGDFRYDPTNGTGDKMPYLRLHGQYTPQEAFIAYCEASENSDHFGADHCQVFLVDDKGEPVAVLDIYPEDLDTNEEYTTPEGYIHCHGFDFDPHWGWLPYEHLKEQGKLPDGSPYMPNDVWGYAQ